MQEDFSLLDTSADSIKKTGMKERNSECLIKKKDVIKCETVLIQTLFNFALMVLKCKKE